jgi:UPF0271 protein
VIDLACDVGEGYGQFRIGHDALIVPLISAANVGCGFHGGDPTTMRTTIRLAAKHGVAVGAHFGFPDLLGFGRRSMDVAPTDLTNYVLYQMGAIAAMCRAEKVPMSHVKPHGALYDMAAQSAELAEAMIEAVASFDPGLVIYTTPGTETERAARRAGIPVALEVYADRAVDDSGQEISGYDLALLGGSVDAMVKRMVDVFRTSCLASVSGKPLKWTADTIAFHGDAADAPELAQALRHGLEAAGMTIGVPVRRT